MTLTMQMRETMTLLHVNIYKGPEQTAHLHSLVSAFVIHSLESMIAKLSTDKISRS